MKKPIKPLEELLDSVRDIKGFPTGKDEDILALSDPPYYTACPNPYIDDFIEEYGRPYDEETDDYHREPMAMDVSEGKNDSLYMAHAYPTKVPYKAIMRYIDHYTNKGDIVLDGFCGTGMTGVAAQLLDRKAILSDLSPIATFISYNYNNLSDFKEFERVAKNVLAEIEEECGWMYETKHSMYDDAAPDGLKQAIENCYGNDKKGKINFIVWSDVFVCPYCDAEHIFWEEALDNENKCLKSEYLCPSCKANLQKKNCLKAMQKQYDPLLNIKINRTKQSPVLINYTFGKKRFEKKPDEEDFLLIKKIQTSPTPYWVPVQKMMIKGTKWGDTWRAGVHLGISYVHHFYTFRNLWLLAALLEKVKNLDVYFMKFLFSSMISRSTQLNRVSIRNFYYGGGGWNLSPLAGTLYYPSLSVETSVIAQISSRIKLLGRAIKSIKYQSSNNVMVSINSATELSLKEDLIDYIFTDPPFGDNLMYSELNFISESWMKILTNNAQEAIINNSQNKKLFEYHKLMSKSFKEYYRILKPNRWITIVFHNSKSSVWNSIQEAITKAGFIIAQVAILDKKQGSFKQVTAAGAVKNDLVISAYKPKQSFDKRFLELAGEGLEEEFIKMHLSHLKTEPTIERTEQMLYSKLLAYYVQRSYAIKYDASTFYKMLRNNFIEEDGYWFNKDQLENYREFKQKMKLEGIEDLKSGQMMLFIGCERTAIIWLHTFLGTPKDFQAIHPAFTKIANISGDSVPELMELLDKNFILESGKYRRPQTEDEKMTVTQKRVRELQREFDVLLLEAKGSKKKIKECRKQAVIYGFEQCYKHNRFQDILVLGKRLDNKIIENDSEISEFIEVAELKVEGF